MTTNVLKGTRALDSKPVWIWTSHIVSMHANEQGGAVISTIDGAACALIDTPEAVIKTMGRLTGGLMVDGKLVM